MTTSPEAGPGPDSQLADFAGQLAFRLDAFQVQACEALERGHGVLVCAPTGAGKTVVGEFAVHLALAQKLGAPIVAHDRPMMRAADAWPGALSVRSQ